MTTPHRNKILFVNSFSPHQYAALTEYADVTGRKVEPILLFDMQRPIFDWVADAQDITVIRVDFSDRDAVQTCLKPLADQIITATTTGDSNVPLLKRVIPFLPYCVLPTETSLEWTTEKTKMRALLRNYDREIAPKFAVIHDAETATLDRIEKQVGYPLVVKPSGLAASLLVSICYHREELEQVLTTTIKKIDQIYKTKKGRGIPQILVEGFMEGIMYSVDAYVNASGGIFFTPLVYVKTGKEVGFDDFFGYMRMTPAQLNTLHTDEALAAATKGIHALGMRSTTCHIELMRTENGWRVIEMGPRMGGFRHVMYSLSFGINHSLNDVLIRDGRKPIIPKKTQGYTAVMQFYAKSEGKLVRIQGTMKAQALASMQRFTINKEPGDKCTFAKNGGDPVLEAVLFNKVRSDLLADIRRIEQNLEIIVA